MGSTDLEGKIHSTTMAILGRVHQLSTKMIELTIKSRVCLLATPSGEQ